MRRFWMLLVALVALVIFMAVPSLAAENRSHCLCGQTTAHESTVDINGCDGQLLTWEPWTSTSSLPTATANNAVKNYYLTANVTVGGQAKTTVTNSHVRIDLNGKTVQNKSTSNLRMFWLNGAGTNITITDTVGGGKFVNSSKYAQGGVFWIAATNSRVTLINGIIDASRYRNSATNNFGGCPVTVASGTAKFIMYGGEIIGNKDATANIPSAGAAVGVSSSGGTFELHGGKIYGGKVAYQLYTASTPGLYGGWGGAVFITSGGKMTMTGGEIIGGTAIAATATNTGTNETKTDGGLGGAVYLGGTLTMSGGKIYGGSAVSALDAANNTVGGKGDNVYVASTGTLNISGGEILGGVDASEAASVQISGNAKIKRDVSSSTNYSLNLGSKPITVGTMAEGAEIYITASNIPRALYATEVTAGTEAYFHSDSADYGVALNTFDSTLWVGPAKCQCAGAGKDGACVGVAGGCDGTPIVWLPWTETTTLPKVAGNWYLTGKVTLSTQVNNFAGAATINLDLKGNNIETSANRGIWLDKAIVLTITDSVGGGTFKNTANHDQGGIFWIAAAGSHVRLINGIMDATGFRNRGANNFGGTAVTVASSTGKFTMYGGELKANANATTNIPSAGAAVAVSSRGGTFELHGGKIYGGKVMYQPYVSSSSSGLYGGLGGAVFITNGGNMTMTGGEIIGGTAIAATATVPNTTTDQTGGGLGGTIYLAGTLNMSGGTISGGSVVSTLDSASNTVGGKGDNIYVASTGTLNISGGEILGGVDAGEAASVQVSGTAKIDRGDATNTTYSLNLGSKELTVDALAAGASIRITADEGAFTGAGRTAEELAYFAADRADQAISYYSGMLYLGKFACICGSTTDVHKNYNDKGVLVGCDGTKVVWTPWTSTSALPTISGNFYLTSNVLLTGQTSLTANSHVVLDLNGYQVTPAQKNGEDVDIRMISIHNSGAKLTITDTYVVPETTAADYDANRTGGEIVGSKTRSYTHSSNKGDTGCVVWVRWLDSFTEGTTFVMLGGKLTGADVVNPREGSVLNVSTNGKFYMLGGTITGGKSGSNGANVYISATASMVMTGGTVSEGKSTNGGNVYANANSTFQLLGGTIENGSATGNGGNIFLGENVNMTLEGATITQGNAKNGGNITIDTGATLTMESGSITDSTATNGQNVQVFGNLVVNGGKIEGLTHVINWNVLSGASITLSGAADMEQITLTKGTNLADMDVNTIALPVITIEGTLATTVTENGVERTLDPILVNTYQNQDTYISGTTVAANAARFTTDYEGRGVHFVEGENKLYVGKYSCLCGTNCNGATPGCDGEKVIWTAWNSASDSAKMPSTTGNYYLTESFTVSTQTKPVAGAQIRLDLNGHTITRNDYRLYALTAESDANGNNIALFITDNSAAGTGTLKSTLKNTTGYDGQGTVLWIASGNDVTLLKGKLDASGMVTSGRGAAVTSDNAGSVFKMYSGTVIGGTGSDGGSIGSAGGTVEIYGGTVNGGTATNGGAIYSTGTLTIEGATINGGTATNGGTIYSTGTLTIEGATINGGTATYGGAIHTAGTLTLVRGTVTGGEAEKGGNIYIDANGEAQLNGGTVTNGKAIRYSTTGGTGGNIYIIGNLTINGGTVENGKAGTLDANGETVLFTTAGWGGNIYLDVSEDKAHSGSLNMINGTIGKGESKGNGGSIYMNANTEMTMSDGTVENGISHADQGGNIFCSGSLTVTGGTIQNGIAKNGGNIGINTPNTVSISGGTISGGQAGTYDATTGKVTLTGNGGNIRVNSTNTTCALTISGSAKILGGQAATGGNISIEQNGDGKTSTLNIQGGTVSGGSATNGGNIYVKATTTFNMNGGTVSNGLAGATNGNGKGGNLYLGGNASITGGTISGGQAGAAKTDTQDAKTGWGGNIYTLSNQLTVGGSASITGGWANNNGGSVHIGGGTMLMNGGTLSGGTTADRGGNIFVTGGCTLTVTDGLITGGKAASNKRGGNISGNAGTENAPTCISLSGVTISGGSAANEASANLDIATLSVLTLGNGVNIQGGLNMATSGVTVNLTGKINITGMSLYQNLLALDGLDADSTVQFTCSNAAEGRILTDTLDAKDLLGASALEANEDYRIAVNADSKLFLTKKAMDEFPGATINGSELVLPLNAAVSLVAGTEDWLQLNSDHEGDIAVEGNLNLDLNGRELNGKITVAEGKTLYIADTNNADYTDKGGRITGQIEGDVAQVFLTGGWEGYGHNYRFAVLKDEKDGVTTYHAHRIYLAVKSMVLHPGSSAVNFRTVLKCDDTLKEYIESYGATVKAIVDGNENTESCQYDLEESAVLGSGEENLRITRLSNILSPDNEEAWAKRSAIPLSGQGYFTLKDATGIFTIESAFKGNKTFKDLVIAADKLTNISLTQQNALAGMYARHYELMKDWDLEKIPTLSELTLQFHCLCGDPSDTTSLCADEGHVTLAWQKWTDALAKAQNGDSATAATTLPKVTGNYYLDGPVQLASQAGIPSGALICIDTQNHNIESVGRVALIHAGGTLHLTNSLGGNSMVIGSGHNSGSGRNGATLLNQGDLCLFKCITVTANNVNGISAGVVETAGSLYIYGANVTGAALTTAEGVANASKGSAIHLSGVNSRLYINSGTITGTDVSGNGGAICITNGEAEIAGTTQVIGSKAALGGAIYMAEGTFTLSGGTVSGGNALQGANIYVADGQFNMSGGTLPGGEYTSTTPTTDGTPYYPMYEGCNLYLAGGTFEMTGGTIKDANATGQGANVYINTGAEAIVSGGVIKDGIARRYMKLTGSDVSATGDKLGGHAGNIYLKGSLTIKDKGSIEGGKAGFINQKQEVIGEGWGGSITLSGSAAALTIENGGTISGGKAWGNGGNIRADGGSVTVSGGTITLGQSINDRGGNIWMAGGSTLEISSGTVSNGNTKGVGGNIHCNNNATIRLLGGTITGGSANNSTGNTAANISLYGDDTKLTLGSITVNGGFLINLDTTDTLGTGFQKLTGNPQIGGNGLSMDNNKTDATFGPTFQIENLDATASVKIRNTSDYPLLIARGDLTDAQWLACEGYVSNFVAYNEDYAITFEADGIYQRALEEGTRYSCECGANRGVDAHVDGCNGYDVLWRAWDMTAASNSRRYLPTAPGYWYLTGTTTGSGENAYIQNVGQTTISNDYYQDADGNYHALYSMLALSTAGSTMKAEDETYVSVAEYTTPVYADDVGAVAPPFAYKDVATGTTYSVEEAAAAGIVPLESYEIHIDLNGMKLETGATSRMLSFRGSQGTLAKEEYTDSEGNPQTRSFSGWRQAEATVSFIDSSEGHTGCLATYGVYTKGSNGQQLYRSSGTQWQGGFVWMPNETEDTLNTYYVSMDASTLITGSGPIYTSGKVNLWHSTLTGGTAQGCFNDYSEKDEAKGSHDALTGSNFGGGALTLISGAEVTMHGGVIQNGTSIYRHMTDYTSKTSDRDIGGGNVFISDGTFTMYGGEIKGGRALVYSGHTNPELNYCSYGSGGGVYVYGGELILKGDAKITDNSSGIVTGTIVEAGSNPINAYNYVDVATLQCSDLVADNVYLGGNTLKAENFTGSVCYNTGKYINENVKDYAGSLVSLSGSCPGTLTRETPSGVAIADTGSESTYLVGYGIADIHPSMEDLKAGLIMTNYGNERDTSTLYRDGSPYDFVADSENAFGSWDTKLYATALATTDGDGDTVIIISVDSSTFSKATTNTVKRLVSAATGVPADNISISSGHQHSAPPASKVYEENEDGTYSLKTNYAFTFYKGVLEAAVAAMEDRKQATVSVGTLDTTAEGKQYSFVRNVKILSNGTHVGMITDNHSTHYKSGSDWYASLTSWAGKYTTLLSTPISKPSLEYETEMDTTMQIVRYSQQDGTDIIMTNFQTHPHLGSGSDSCYVQSDMIGAFRNYLAEKTGSRVMYFSGASGNVNPTSKISADAKLYSYANHTCKATETLVQRLEKVDVYGQTLATMAYNFLNGTDYTTYNGSATKTVAMRDIITATTGSKDVKSEVRTVTYNVNTSSATEAAIQKLVMQTDVLQEGVTRPLIDWSTGSGAYVANFSSDNEIWARYVGYSSNRNDRIFSLFHARNIHEMLMWQEAGIKESTIDITAYALGEVGFVAAPYEMFQESGSDIKHGTANSQNAGAYTSQLVNPFVMTIVATQANGGSGYIPSSLAYDNGGYSTDIANFAKGTAELLVTNYIDMLNNLK